MCCRGVSDPVSPVADCVSTRTLGPARLRYRVRRNAPVLRVHVISERLSTPAAVRSLVTLGSPAAMPLEVEDALFRAIAAEDDGSGRDPPTPRWAPACRRIPLHDEASSLSRCAARSGHDNLVTVKLPSMQASRKKNRARRKPPIRIGSRRARAVKRRTPKLPLADFAWSALQAGRRASA